MTRLPVLVSAAVPLLALAVWLEKEQDVKPDFGTAAEMSFASADVDIAAYEVLSLELASPKDTFLSLQSRQQEEAHGWTFASLDSSSSRTAPHTLRMRVRPVMDVSDGSQTITAAVYRFSYTDSSVSQQEPQRYSF